ncbi:MAG TPA: nucleoside hydrolase-like domain-containing protein, partial [Chitinophagaceae bacterium]|nr:nucleoside hydrolase-like domain-containing protein [Chitinophagaceae bacterium]
MRQLTTIALTLLFLTSLISSDVFAQADKKHRVLVLTDIEADPDDAQSLIRFLLYSNQWDVEGLIATTSIHQQTRVAPESILKILDAYKKIQPNLLKHEKGFPSYDILRSKVKKGLAVYGMQGVGEGKDSEG